MGTKYTCKNNNCSYPGDTQFEMRFKSETIMDKNNFAAVFCPFCKQEMDRSVFMDVPSDPEIDFSQDLKGVAS